MTTYNPPSTVGVGLTPNDGTGDTLRNAFIKQNNNFAELSSFIYTNPTFNVATITTLNSDMITANIGTFNNELYTVGNATIGSNLYVSGTLVGSGNIVTDQTFKGNVTGPTATFNTFNTVNDAEIGGNLIVNTDVEVHGSLTVFGNVLTVTSTDLVVNSPTIEIGGNGSLSWQQNDGFDRGVDFYWYSNIAAAQKTGFFGFDNTPEMQFTYTPDKNSGLLGNALFDTVTANVTSLGHSDFNTLTSNVVTAVSGFAGNLVTNAQPNVTSLGTLTYLNVGSKVQITGNTIFIDGSPVATSASSFTGGTVPGWTDFQDVTPSINTTTGAVKIAGGLGVQGNVHVGGNFTTVTFNSDTLGGLITTPEQPNISSVGTLGNLVVAGSINANSVSITSLIASDTISASIISASVGLGGTLTTAAQPNITSIGTLASLNVTGNVTGNRFLGDVTGEVIGNISGSSATVTSAVQPAITSVGTLSALDVTGNITSSGINAGSGVIQTTGNITTTSNVNCLNVYGSVRTAAQPNITSVGTLNGLTVSGNGQINGTTALVNTVTFGGAPAMVPTGSGSQSIGTITNRFGSVYSASVNNSGVITSGSFIGAHEGTVGAGTPNTGTFTTVTVNGSMLTNSTANIGSLSNRFGTLHCTAVDISGVLTANTFIVNDSILTSGNLVSNVGSTTNRFNSMFATTFVGQATSSSFADLAENYRADGQYEPTTVVVFGGSYEVTTTGHFADSAVAGVVSTAPGYLMNSEETHGIPIALRGKVPCKIMGPVRKGDLLVTSATPGYGESVGKDGSYGVAVFAKSLDENLAMGPKIINAVII